MENSVIKVLNRRHGLKVLNYFDLQGVDTANFWGNCTEESNGIAIYYGVINDKFSNYTLEEVKAYNAEIIELPEEKVYPRVMMVSCGEFWYKRVVLMEKCGKYLAWNNAKTMEEAENELYLAAWKFAKDIEEPKEITITLSDINSKMDDIKKLFGAEENDKIVIKVD